MASDSDIRDAVRYAVGNDPRSQSRIAADARIARGHLSRYLSGKREMRSDSLERLFTALGIVLIPSVR